MPGECRLLPKDLRPAGRPGGGQKSRCPRLAGPEPYARLLPAAPRSCAWRSPQGAAPSRRVCCPFVTVTAASLSCLPAQVIPPPWLRLFSPAEVNQLLGGGEGGEIDVRDMQAHAQYRQVYDIP